MPDWYYRDQHDNTVGPVKPGELLQLIRDGELSEDTLVRKDDSQWVRSVEINGLWQAAARPDTEFCCPVCSTSLPKPPCRCPKCLKYVDKAVGKIKKASVNAKQLAKIREAASQPVQHVSKQEASSIPRHEHVGVQHNQPAKRTSKPASQNSSRWWHSLLPRKK